MIEGNKVIFEFTSYSKYLKAVLLQKQQTNRAYSLRAMAKNIGISATTLSDVINERKNLSDEIALKVANKLQLTGRKEKYFITLVQYATTKNEELNFLLINKLRVLNPKVQEHFNVQLDKFSFMSEWYHIPILEMTYLSNQDMSPTVLAESLDISIQQATEAINTLQRLNLLEKKEDGSFKKSKNQFKFQSENSHHILRKFHYQMLAKAQESLHTQTPQQKLVGSETLPLNIEDLPAANDIIEFCFQQILELSKRSQNKTHVYHLGI